jgi:hypothetical protein
MMMMMATVWDHRKRPDRERGDQERLADRNFEGLHWLQCGPARERMPGDREVPIVNAH